MTKIFKIFKTHFTILYLKFVSMSTLYFCTDKHAVEHLYADSVTVNGSGTDMAQPTTRILFKK